MAGPWEKYGGAAAAPATAMPGPPVIQGPPRLPPPQTPVQARKDEVDLRIAEAKLAGEAGQGGGGPKLSPQERAYLNDMRNQAAAAADIYSQYDGAWRALVRSGLEPDRAKIVRGAIPQEDGGIFSSFGPRLNRWIYGVSDDEMTAFQTLERFQNANVLDRQLAQKGPQTESDALRLKLTELSPFRTFDANEDVIRSGMIRARMMVDRPAFYINWANKHGGLNALDEQGRSADQVWQERVRVAYEKMEALDDVRDENAGQPWVNQLSSGDLLNYKRLAESGATAEELETWVLNKTGGRARLSNSREVVQARDRGAGVSTDFKIRRIR